MTTRDMQYAVHGRVSGPSAALVPLGVLMVLCAPAAMSGIPDAQTRDIEPHRTTDARPDIPSISFIDSPAATCYGPLAEVNACYINWPYLQVSATSPNYMNRMTLTIDGRVRAVYTGFFQASMFVPSGMHAEGFKVACGIAGASGDPDSGRHYAYAIDAVETGGLSSANYGTVICPADYRLDLIFRNGFDLGLP